MEICENNESKMDDGSKIPYKAIFILLMYRDINFRDILNFSMTCRIFDENINTDCSLWHYKMSHRWPNLERICGAKWWCKSNDVEDKEASFIRDRQYVNTLKTEIKRRINWRNKLIRFIELKNICYYHMDDICSPDMSDFDNIFVNDINDDYIRYHYLQDELIDMIESRDVNLTYAYYAEMILYYMNHCYLNKAWEKFKNRSAPFQVLEDPLFIALHWFEVKRRGMFPDVKKAITHIALKVLKYLETFFDCLIIERMKTYIAVLAKQNIDNNCWDFKKSEKILRVIHHIVHEDYYSSIGKNNTVWPIVLTTHPADNKEITVYASVIFLAVARRFGIRCDLLASHSSNSILSWRRDYASPNDDNNILYEIDIFSKEFTLQKRVTASHFQSLTNGELAIYIMGEVANYVIISLKVEWNDRLIHEFDYMMKPKCVRTILDLWEYYVVHKIYNCGMIDILMETLKDKHWRTWMSSIERYNILECVNKSYITIKPQLIWIEIGRKQRNAPIKYAIGMFAKFVYLNQTKLGVIFEWDIKYNFEVNHKRGTSNQLIIGRCLDNQPYYMIFCSDNEKYYIPEEDVTPTKETTNITHKEVGRFFAYKETNHYVPSPALKLIYMMDDEIRDDWLNRLWP